jgi:Domain of unknown function (DUF5666)
MIRKQFSTWLVAAAVVIASACGGGEGGGIGGTGSPVAVSYGGVTALGSVWVNGVEFDTRSASIRIDDRSGTEAELQVGMVVQVDGSISAARADTVTVESALKGFVERVDDANHLVVMGQTVQVDDRTVYEGGAPVVGDRVEVHGLVVAEGVVFGSRVARKASAPTPAFAAKGYVKNTNSAAKTFTLGTLTVNYTGATLSDLGNGPTDGQFVEVKGTACGGTPVCGTLTASRVQASGLRVSGSAQAEVEGFVAPGSLAGSNFRIGAQAVTSTPATLFIGGALADVLAGTRLEVEGTLTNGVLAATRVRFLDSIRIEANVATRVGNTLTFDNLPGVTVSANGLTGFSGIVSLAGLSPGDFVRLRGRPGGGQAVVAMQIELRSGGNGRTILQATVDRVAAPQLTLLGVTLDTTPILEASFQGIDGSAIGRSAFFAAVKAGSLVKARGTPSGAGLVLDEIEFED